MIFILCYLFIIYAIIEHYSHGMRFLEFVSSFGSSMKNPTELKILIIL